MIRSILATATERRIPKISRGERSNSILLAARRNGHRTSDPRLPHYLNPRTARRRDVSSRADDEFADVERRTSNGLSMISIAERRRRVRTRGIPRGSFRVSPLCLQTSGFSPSPFSSLFRLYVFVAATSLPPSYSLSVRSLVPSLARFFVVVPISPHRSLAVFLVSLRTPSPARPAKKDRESLSVSFLPTRPLPSRPLRFKSPSDGDGDGGEDVNFTWHGNTTATAMLNREMGLRIGEAYLKISRRPQRQLSRVLFTRSIFQSSFLY